MALCGWLKQSDKAPVNRRSGTPAGLATDRRRQRVAAIALNANKPLPHGAHARTQRHTNTSKALRGDGVAQGQERRRNSGAHRSFIRPARRHPRSAPRGPHRRHRGRPASSTRDETAPARSKAGPARAGHDGPGPLELQTSHSVGRDVYWVGSHTQMQTPTEQRALRDQLLREQRYAPVFLDAKRERLFYDGFCKRVLWPLFHSSPPTPKTP